MTDARQTPQQDSDVATRLGPARYNQMTEDQRTEFTEWAQANPDGDWTAKHQQITGRVDEA